ncbi:hypothetical protein LA080_011028 [Diaporthe eres]|nr:hypothetical protein LA080_011028 [Diaporthe eres]
MGPDLATLKYSTYLRVLPAVVWPAPPEDLYWRRLLKSQLATTTTYAAANAGGPKEVKTAAMQISRGTCGS